MPTAFGEAIIYLPYSPNFTIFTITMPNADVAIPTMIGLHIGFSTVYDLCISCRNSLITDHIQVEKYDNVKIFDASVGLGEYHHGTYNISWSCFFYSRMIHPYHQPFESFPLGLSGKSNGPCCLALKLFAVFLHPCEHDTR